MFTLRVAMHAIPMSRRKVQLSDECRLVYRELLKEASGVQDNHLYNNQFIVSVFGKLPEQSLRMAVLCWCVRYVSDGSDALIVPNVGPLLEVQDLRRAVK